MRERLFVTFDAWEILGPLIGLLWVASAFAGAFVGQSRKAEVQGFLLGLFLGPMGVAAAFRMDNRTRCPQCREPSDDLALRCPFCGIKFAPKSKAPAPSPSPPEAAAGVARTLAELDGAVVDLGNPGGPVPPPLIDPPPPPFFAERDWPLR